MSSQAKHWFEQSQSRFAGQLLFDEPMSRHTYYRIGGPVSIMAIPKTIEDLHWIAEGIRSTGVRLFILGAGSNLLVSDQGFDGLIVKAGRLNLEILQVRPGLVRTGGGVMISTLLGRAAREGWGGFEFLTGIPGTVGGVIRMNGGTHLGEAKERVRRVEAYPLLGAGASENFSPIEYEGEQLKFMYRKNQFLPEGSVVYAVEWEVRQEEPARVKAVIDETLTRRKNTQPLDHPSCGSVFKNPKESGMSAWQVVDKLGLRGHRIGDAQFAEKHSNFILNLGSATAADVQALIHLAKSRAEKELGIRLEEEVIYLK